jgi:AP-3 complex subunit delta-1
LVVSVNIAPARLLCSVTFARSETACMDACFRCSQVVSCAVNVICELARKKPKNYLPLAPDLFKILTTSRNNWMLIKVVKLLGALVEEEPRLARKLLEPLANTIQSTAAKSLMYECVYAVRVCVARAHLCV